MDNTAVWFLCNFNFLSYDFVFMNNCRPILVTCVRRHGILETSRCVPEISCGWNVPKFNKHMPKVELGEELLTFSSMVTGRKVLC